MVKIPTNLTIHSAEQAKSDSLIFRYPIKVISGYYSVQDSATTGLSDGEQARRFADSLAGTEVMFDIILHADARSRVIGHMYQEGSYGEFIFMYHNGIAFYTKLNGIWSARDL